MRAIVAFACALLACVGFSHAEDFVFERASKPQFENEIVLGAGRSNFKARESWFLMNGELQVRNVDQATLVPFLPAEGEATGDAMIVAPGGAFLGLAIEDEGYKVAEALAARGIAAFVLKYRVTETPADFDTFAHEMREGRSGRPSSVRPPEDTPPQSLADGRAAVNYVRSHAAQWGVDPARIGMTGFSAGAILTLSVVIDAPEDERPSFAAPVYPRMAAVEPPENAPPLFVAIAADDFLMGDKELGLIRSWLHAGAPVEFHLFQTGGHGFGLGDPGTTTGAWIDLLTAWIELNREESERAAQ